MCRFMLEFLHRRLFTSLQCCRDSQQHEAYTRHLKSGPPQHSRAASSEKLPTDEAAQGRADAVVQGAEDGQGRGRELGGRL